MTEPLPRIAVIGTGGTISSLGASSLDVLDYPDFGQKLTSEALLARFPETRLAAQPVPVTFRQVGSTAIGPADWLELRALIHRIARDDPAIAGFVIPHGTATLEETAFFLNLTLGVDRPVVLVGAQRPASALGSDAGMNLYNALRVAGAAESRGKGVLVVLNDEIHAARDVVKTSTYRVQTFRSLDFGALGHVDGDGPHYYRAPLKERRAVVVRAVAVDMAERAEIEAAKRLNAIGRGLYHVARGVDFVVEHDEHALAARFRRPGDAQRVVEVHPGIAAERAGRALRTDQHYRPIDPQRQVEEERGLLQRRRPVRDDKAGDGQVVARDPVEQRPQFEPVRRADRGAADLAEGDRHRLRRQPGFRKPREQRLAGQFLPEIGIVEDVEARRAERGDRAAGADDRDSGQGLGHRRSSLAAATRADTAP